MVAVIRDAKVRPARKILLSIDSYSVASPYYVSCEGRQDSSHITWTAGPVSSVPAYQAWLRAPWTQGPIQVD